MGICARLFHNPQDRENSLSYRITPSDQQYSDQRDRWNDLADVVKQELRDWSGLPVSSWLQGSYKFGTQIRPASKGGEFDIDLGVYLEWSGAPDDGQFGPKEIKDKVQEILVEYAAGVLDDETKVKDPKTRCNRISFADDFHIDIPSYHLDRREDERNLATEDDEWEQSDPKAIYVWWKDSFDADVRELARRMVRCLKMWATLKLKEDSRPSSIMLTVLAAEAILAMDLSKLSGDDQIFAEIAKAIDKRMRSSSKVKNPVATSENLNRISADGFETFLSELETLTNTSARAVASQDLLEAADLWSQIFLHFFPMPEDEEIEAVAKSFRSNALQVLQFVPDVRVVAKIGSREIVGLNAIGPVPKGTYLEFSIANRNSLPVGADISWMVRNDGQEAERENDLGHSSGSGLSNKEHTAYKGTHFMDVVVRLNGRPIGRRRVKVIVSSIGAPGRNPPKPAWSALRNRGR